MEDIEDSGLMPTVDLCSGRAGRARKCVTCPPLVRFLHKSSCQHPGCVERGAVHFPKVWASTVQWEHNVKHWYNFRFPSSPIF